MPFEQVWGADNLLGLALPERLLGYLLILLYSLSLFYLLYQLRSEFQKLSQKQWQITGGLVIAAFITSQLFPIPFPSRQFTPADLTPHITLLASAPFLLAGVVLGPLPALIVGAASGLGRSLGESHQFFDIFHFAFAAVLAAYWLQQNYAGRLYEWLRHPVVAGGISITSTIFLRVLANFASTPNTLNSMESLDVALASANFSFVTLLLEGMIGGGIVWLILHNLPELRPAKTVVPSPSQRSLRLRLLNQFALFATVLLIILVTVVFNMAALVSTRLMVNQMAHNAQTVANEIPDFQKHLQDLLTQYEESLLSADKVDRDKALEQLFRGNPLYRYIILINQEQEVASVYPPDNPDIKLTDSEKRAVDQTLFNRDPGISPIEPSAEDHVLSFVVPLLKDGEVSAVLVARVPQFSLNNLAVGLQGAVEQGSGFIVDEYDDVIAVMGNGRSFTTWQPPTNVQQIQTSITSPGTAYRGYQPQAATRELVYYITSTGSEHPWTVVATIPYSVVLGLAWGIGWPLTLAMTVILGVFYANLAILGRDITNPITELVEASKTLAAGGNWTPAISVQRDDEVGQLSKSFAQMQRSMKQRLNELLLLLGVSQDVSNSIDINQGMPTILRGALRGTVASGARAVVLNPSGGYPLAYGEGPAASAMAVLDRQLMTRLRQSKELMSISPEQTRAALELPETAEIPVQAILAVALYSHDRFQGVLWLGYRQSHNFDLIERNLLQTLAGQAAVLVENARLFSTAEGGRRRLAAVLASTSDAVIVTDQTERVLLINRAMEKIFRLRAGDVIGRPVADVIKVEQIVKALTGPDEHVRNLEIPIIEGKTYYTNASTIISNDGQALGRVAVLHDITHLKEVDAMKSEFVATVSHDLRSPLTFMRGYATMLPMVGELSDKQREYIDKILSGIDQMTQLVNDLLDLGRIEGRVDLRSDPIEVQPLLTEIATEYWQHAHLSGIKLQVDVPSGLPVVKGDTALVRQAITNLINNGIKYAPNSGPMRLKAEQQNGEVVISVQDNGPGIPAQDQARLFEKFYRVKQRGTEKIKGSGLGLAIVKSIAERHGGRAWCQSQVGRGTTFYISLPLPEASKQ